MINISLPDPSYLIATKETKDGIIKLRIDVDLCAKYLLENIDVLTIEETQEIMVFDEITYMPGERFIEQILETILGGEKSDKDPGKILLDTWTIAEIMAKIRRRSAIKQSKFEALQAQSPEE